VNGFYHHLRNLHQSQARHVIMTLLFFLTHTFMEEVTSALLSFQLPLDKYGEPSALVYLAASALSAVLAWSCRRHEGILASRVCFPPQAASAVCEVLSVHKGTSAVTFRLFPRLLMALLVQAHYILLPVQGRTSLPPLREMPAEPAAESLLCCVVEAVKTLLLKMGCHYEFTFVEKERGWDMLTSPKTHYRGVTLLARAMVHYNCCELWRILYHLVPFLEQGDKQLKITAMAFFVELLHMPEAKRLPREYSVTRLVKGLADCDPVMRALCVKGLITIIKWPRKDVQGLVPAMMKSLQGVDGRLVVEALANVGNILSGLEKASYTSCITRPLRLLFDDVRK
uniref:Uncharacterized protein n=1 Tax=Dromaius novaehollandiae TaxID=8790 RepID=A0A8C4K0Z5_DRONO